MVRGPIMKKYRKMEGEPRVLTVGEVAKYLRVHQTTIYRLLKTQKLPAFRVGSDWRFNLEAIEEWMKKENQVK
jgi:excisionase family DNA binding protein